MNETYGWITDNIINDTNWNVTFLNSTNEKDCSNWKGQDPNDHHYSDVPYFLVCMYLIIGTAGNCLVILAISLDPNLRNAPNYLRLSFAVADFLIITLSLPGRIILYHSELPPSVLPLCYVELIVLEYTLFSSMVHVSAISFDRYFAIKSPMQERKQSRKKLAIKIGLVWLISSITSLLHLVPISLSIMGQRSNHLASMCDRTPESCLELYYTMPFFNLVFLVESIVLFGACLVIAITLVLITILLYKLVKKQKENGDMGLVRTAGGKNKNESNEKKTAKVLKNEQKALMVVWSISVTFLICTVPHVYCIMSATTGHYSFPSIVLQIESSLLFANPCINPFIYTIFNERFRDDYKNLILFRYKKVTEKKIPTLAQHKKM